VTANVWLTVLVGAIGMIAVGLVALVRRRLARIGKQLADTRRDHAAVLRQVRRLIRRVKSVSQETMDVHRVLGVANREQQRLADTCQDALSRLEQIDERVRTLHLAVSDSVSALDRLAGTVDSGIARLASREDVADLRPAVSRLEELNTAMGCQGQRLVELHTLLERQQSGLNHIVGALDGHAGRLEDVRSALAGHGREVEQCTVALHGMADDLKGISRTANVEREEILGLLHAEFLQLDEVRQLMRAHVSHIDESFNGVQRLLDQLVVLEQALESAGPPAHGGPGGNRR
jgi:chromosome segregation ATPase